MFLKLSSYEDSAELKNLVVRNRVAEGEAELASFEDLARPLIEKAIRYCEVREIGKLEIELPQREYAIVSLFMQLGFRIAALRERYTPGQYVCFLEKTIGERYNADPFDLVKLGKWLLRAILPCKVGAISPIEDVPHVPFEVYPSHPAFSPGNARGYAKRLRGSLIILDEGDCDEDNIQRLLRGNDGEDLFGDGQLRYVLAHELTEQSRAMLLRNGITPFDLDEVREIAGGARSSLGIPIHRSDVGGMLTVLEAEHVTDYALYKKSFVYYLLSGIGSALDGANQAGSLLAVFCPSWRDGKNGIVAIAEIEEITDAPFDKAFDCYPGVPKALTKEDLAFYRTRSDKDRLPVLKCSRLRVFPTPLDIEGSSLTISAEERAYLNHELEETNSIYVSHKMCEGLRQYSSRFASQPNGAGRDNRNGEISVGGTGRRSANSNKSPSMRIVFLSANPVGGLDLEEEFRSCAQELRGVKFRDSITRIFRHAVRPDDLIQSVREDNPNVLHFSGHGSKDGIILRTDTGEFQPVEGASLKRFLSGRGIDLLVLNACYSDVQAESVQGVVESVIGTTGVVDDEAARRFATAFYRSLGNGLSIGEAFRDGRDAVDLHGLQDVFKSSGNLDLVLVRGKGKR